MNRTTLSNSVGLLLLAASLGCPEEQPVDTSSCAPWSELSLPASISVAPVDAIKVLGPAPDTTYPGFYSIGDVAAGYESFVDKSNDRAPAIAFTFHDWTGRAEGGGYEINDLTLRTFDSAMEDEDTTMAEFIAEASAQGSVVAVAWDALGYYSIESVALFGFDGRVIKHEDILSGVYDDYIRHIAGQVSDLEVPIMLSPFGEFGVAGEYSYGAVGEAFQTKEDAGSVCDQYGDEAWPDGPERVRDIFRYVIDIFRDEAVTNVTWFMYASTGYMNEENHDISWEHPGYYFPGADYMDWIGHSVYLTADETMVNEIVGDLEYGFDAGYDAWREVTDLPFYAPEFGWVGRDTDSLAPIIEETLAVLPGKGFDAFTLADAPLFAGPLFALPRLGEREGELEAWNSALDDERYATEVVLSAD